ncbi:hypothetical protein NIES4075_21000 [Tolypothrix sp. NIES-4075]|uniref:hypothetical protein n=1 Tax=Tolypothrix sp. NIES-4075 TaxID=2005459 RepID=UPI000B5CD3EE|nr:hypothetical protein [Tolypothrix sp. NIES-4075]GAX41131.1 hypothetical protein NIES4075_21000 [Tolypothrix sp. NIES-4075]
MKRKIYFVIAFALSFLLMFSPIARAEETKFNTLTTSEPIEIEVAKIAGDTNKADSPPQEKVKVPVIDHKPKSRGQCVPCPSGGNGYWRYVGDDMYCFAICE